MAVRLLNPKIKHSIQNLRPEWTFHLAIWQRWVNFFSSLIPRATLTAEMVRVNVQIGSNDKLATLEINKANFL